jgi:nucleotide-binding universal stress UspA family protein
VDLVVGHDGSAGSRVALGVAAGLAGRLGAAVHVVHAVDLDDYPIDPDSADWEEHAARALRDQYQQVARILGAAGCRWTYQAGRGDPADLIGAVADEVNALMIVVGTRGGGVGAAVSRLLDRSVSREVLRHQRRPVLVVPPG